LATASPFEAIKVANQLQLAALQQQQQQQQTDSTGCEATGRLSPTQGGLVMVVAAAYDCGAEHSVDHLLKAVT
jgi:hypothetical protein